MISIYGLPTEVKISFTSKTSSLRLTKDNANISTPSCAQKIISSLSFCDINGMESLTLGTFTPFLVLMTPLLNTLQVKTPGFFSNISRRILPSSIKIYCPTTMSSNSS